MPGQHAPIGPDATHLTPDAILARSQGENFPVVLRGIPASLREDLLALYAFARLVDQVGDDAVGDRGAMLDALSRDLQRIEEARPEHPILERLAPVVRRHGLPIATLERLIEANRRDQTLRSIATWDELVDSCTRSAHPVGELVLGVLGHADAESVRLSDSICTALQVVEHCQDVSEDFARGRVYLPAEDRVRFGCRAEDLQVSPTPLALRRTVELQVERARSLLGAAPVLLLRLRGVGIPLVAAYAAGGLATCDALERHAFDVIGVDVKPARRDLLRHAVTLCARTLWARARR